MLGIGVEDPAAHAHMHANPTGGSLFHVNLRVCLGSSGHFVATLHTVSNRVDNPPCSERRPCRSPSFGIRDLCLLVIQSSVKPQVRGISGGWLDGKSVAGVSTSLCGNPCA